MSPRSILLIFAALLIAGGTAIVAKSLLGSRPTVVQKQEPQGVMVMIAQTAIPTGAFIQQGHLGWQLWPDKKVPEAYLVEGEATVEDLMGAVVRRGFTPGEPITPTRIVKPGERGFLAAVLRPGHRAMAIKVNATSGISGLVFPGDRVDILLTMTVGGTEEDGGVGLHRASETVMENVRVLAIDQIIDNSSGKPKVAKNVTMELTPKQAEMMAIIDGLGKLRLSLRSLAKDEDELRDLTRPEDPMELVEEDARRGRSHTWDSEVSRLVGGRGKVVNITRGTTESTVSY